MQYIYVSVCECTFVLVNGFVRNSVLVIICVCIVQEL
jgi:hypothetical protein